MLLKVILIVLIVYAIGLANFARGENGRENQQTQFSRGWDNRLRILIIGATGRTSHELVRQALEQGHQVTALVRTPKKMKFSSSWRTLS